MRHAAPGALACALWLASWTASAQTPSFDGRGWTVGHQQRNANQSLTEYVLPGQTVENWRELVTSTVFFQPVPIGRLVDQIRFSMSKDCPSLVWNVIRQDERTAVFEWRDGGCGGFEAQHELDRISLEKDGLYRLAYAVKTKTPLPAERRKQWLAILEQAPPAEGLLSQRADTRRPTDAGASDRSTTMTAVQKLATEQLAAAVRKSGWPCPSGVKSETKGQTPGPIGPLVASILECSNGERYTVLVDPTGAVTSFPVPK